MSLIIICGATATGKSDLAVAVAKKLNAEIINADSMQVYKGMDIGTAKLSVEERQGVPHHLIDVLDINEEANVSWYQNLARKTIDELIKYADGKSVLCNTTDREGVVIRTLDRKYSFKSISNIFLLGEK